jgi:hypothetical protein
MTCPTSEATGPRTPRGHRVARWAVLALMTAAFVTPASAAAYQIPGGFSSSTEPQQGVVFTPAATSHKNGDGNTLPIVLSGTAMLIAVGSAGYAASTRGRVRRSPSPASDSA